jgi:hypothetical protein
MIPVLYFLLSLTAGVEKSRGEKPVILDGSADPAAVNFIYFSSPFGIYVFDRQTQTWSRINQANGLPDNQIEIVGLDEGILWVATATGLASADVRINDWQTHELPGRISGLAFDDQYVWVSGDFGLKRFDKYSEKWQDLVSRPVQDLLRDRDYLWLASDSGIIRYNRRFERIEEIPGAPAGRFERIVNTPGRVWFFGDDNISAYRKSDEVWSSHPGFPVEGIADLNDSLFVVRQGRIYYFEPKMDNWIEFRTTEGLASVTNLGVNAKNLLAATDAGLFVYNWSDRQWKTYNSRNGLARDSLQAVYQQGDLLFCVTDRDIEFFNEPTGIWQVEEYRPSGLHREKILYRDEAGSHLRINRALDLRIQGRAFISYSGVSLDSLIRYQTMNLKLIGAHRSNRLVSLYYDDSDKSDTIYGGSYRGRDRDLLYRLDAGYLKSEYYETDLIPQYYNRGGSMKMRHGPVSLGLQTGQLKSAIRNDFFTGRTSHKTIRIPDHNFMKYVFYYCASNPGPWVRGSDTIFVDDRIAGNNTSGTRVGFAIAGLTGDFDPLLSGRDYFIDYHRGLIHFLAPRSAGERIVLDLNGTAFILQTETQPGLTAENIYFLGPDIIPNSFSLSIRDTAGADHSLWEFGLDQDHDGQVDPKCINYDLGLLVFPDPDPFPDTQQVYTLTGDFDTWSNFYFLSDQPVLIGSEKVYVDGELKTGGVDYVVDYTSGILLFMKPDIASDFSEIHVQYALRQRERTDWFYSGQPVVTVDPGLKFSPGYTRLENRNLYSGSGELAAGAEASDFYLRLIPEALLDDDRQWAQNHRFVGRYRNLSVNARYQGYAPEFDGLGLEQGKYGRLNDLVDLNARVDPFDYFKLEADFQNEIRTDSTSYRSTSRYLTGKASYLDPRRLSGYLSLGRNELPDYGNNIIMAGANCAFSAAATRVKLNAQIRSDDRRWSTSEEESGFGYLVNTNFSLPVPVRVDGYYRSDNIDRFDEWDQKDQEMHGLVNFDLVPGLYCLTNYNRKTRGYSRTGDQELSLASVFYNSVSIAPGKWYLPLSLVNFSIGAGLNCDEYLEDLAADYRPPVFIFGPIGASNISHVNSTNTYNGAVQISPNAALKLWLRHTLTQSGLAYYGRPDPMFYRLDEAKIEFEPRDLGYFLLYVYRRIEPGLPAETADNLYGEWDRSWNLVLRTKLVANHGVRRNDYLPAVTEELESKVVGETIFRFGGASLLSLKFGGRRQQGVDGLADYAMLPGAGLNLNLWAFLYVQFNWDAAFAWRGAASQAGTLKITGQF